MSSSVVNFNVLRRVSSLRSSEFPNCLLNESSVHEVDELMMLLKRDAVRGRLILKQWVQSQAELTATNQSPPLEFIWKLNEEEILFVTTYIYSIPHVRIQLQEAFESIYTQAGSSPSQASAKSVLAGILATVVNTLKSPEDKIKTFFVKVAQDIVESAVKLITEQNMSGCYLSDLLNSVYIFQDCLTEFLLLNLKQLLTVSSSEENPNAILRYHTKRWTSSHLDLGTSFFLSTIAGNLSPDLITSELKWAANQTPFSWKYLLAMVSTLVTESEQSICMVKELTENWLKTGLEQNDKSLLYLALITVRHCCAEKINQFPTYINWYGNACSANPTHFTAFFNFLSELVPYEAPLYLKVHVNKVPTAPPGGQQVVIDYVALAKTRLVELNETNDYLSIFNECFDTDEESLKADVAQLLHHFSTTNEIAKPVIEASVFRKQYYEKVFLVHLLKVPERDDSARALVIKKLNSVGKIPASMFSRWSSL